MRIVCREKWESNDPLVTAQLGSLIDVPWEVRVERLPADRMHASYRMLYAGGELVPRKEDFRIYQVLEIIRPVDRMLVATAEHPAMTGGLCESLDGILVGDKIVVLHPVPCKDNSAGVVRLRPTCTLHLNPEFVDVEIFEE